MTTDPHDDPTELVVAYCAPGLKGYAERLLESNGEREREMVEHPYMTGRTDVILTTDPFWPRTQPPAVLQPRVARVPRFFAAHTP